MRAVLTYVIYSITVVVLAIGCIKVFRAHPEVQFAFLMPGLFIIMYSLIRDEIYKRNGGIHMVRR